MMRILLLSNVGVCFEVIAALILVFCDVAVEQAFLSPFGSQIAPLKYNVTNNLFFFYNISFQQD